MYAYYTHNGGNGGGDDEGVGGGDMASLGHKIWNKMQNAFDMVTSVTHALTKIQWHNNVPARVSIGT